MADPYHVCFAVPDLERAMADLTAAVGAEWNDVRDGRLGEWNYRIVFSTGVPPIELIEGPPGSPWDAADKPRFDHLGWWADAQDATSDRLASAGFGVEFDGNAYGRHFAYHRVDGIGARLEVVDASYREDFSKTWRSDGPSQRPALPAPASDGPATDAVALK